MTDLDSSKKLKKGSTPRSGKKSKKTASQQNVDEVKMDPAVFEAKVSNLENSLSVFSFSTVATELRLVSYVLSLYAIFITWGYLQERITSYQYKSLAPGEIGVSYLWQYPIVLNFLMTASASLTGSLANEIIRFMDPNHSHPEVNFMIFWKAALTGALASPIGYFSLKFISFPMMILAKSSKVNS